MEKEQNENRNQKAGSQQNQKPVNQGYDKSQPKSQTHHQSEPTDQNESENEPETKVPYIGDTGKGGDKSTQSHDKISQKQPINEGQKGADRDKNYSEQQKNKNQSNETSQEKEKTNAKKENK